MHTATWHFDEALLGKNPAFCFLLDNAKVHAELSTQCSPDSLGFL